MNKTTKSGESDSIFQSSYNIQMAQLQETDCWRRAL